MNISDFDYDLPDERIARFPLAERDASKLLVWESERRRRDIGNVTPNRNVTKCGEVSEYPDITETVFGNIGSVLPEGSLLVFNNTRVVRARLAMFKPTGARIEVLCLEPAAPADYERAFAARGEREWKCMVGNSKKWKSGPIEIPYIYKGAEHKLSAYRVADNDGEQIVRFEWDSDLTFGQLLELLGRVPIPPYLGREGEAIDNTRYQTVFARIEGSVAAPTAGLHFTPELLDRLGNTQKCEVTLHVGAGTFLPVKVKNALEHTMHTEHFEVTLAAIEHLLVKLGKIVAVGTTSVRTLESLTALGWRIAQTGGPSTGNPESDRPVGQFEPRDIPAEFDGRTALETLAAWMRARSLDRLQASTRIMISPGLPPCASRRQPSADMSAPVDETFTFRMVDGIVTNFHQPRSTLLLLIAAFTGGNEWRRIYDYALTHDFRFLSYGDSSLLLR